MVQSTKGLIYYVVSQEGQCIIKEINPQNDTNDHFTVLEIKSEKCLAFSYKSPYFYFVDNQKVIHKFSRSQETCLFVEED